MQEIIVEIASPDDAEGIRQVQHDSWIETYPNEQVGITLNLVQELVENTISPKSIQELKESFNLTDRCTWVAKVSSKIVGFSTAKKNDDTNQILAIYVLAEYHGKQVGNNLMEKSLEWLGKKKDIDVEVASYNDRAIRFYEKYNFHKNGQTGDSHGIPTVHLIRRSSGSQELGK